MQGKFNWPSWCRALDNLAQQMHNFKVIPRITLLWYLHNCYHLLIWYEQVPNPSVQQTTFVSIVTALFVPIMKFYMDGSSEVKPTTWAPSEPTEIH